VVIEFGESITESLTSSISKTIPGTIAQIRAFDRAAIHYLDFVCDGKVYSDQEIPSSEYSESEPKVEKKKAAKKDNTPVQISEMVVKPEEQSVESLDSVLEPEPEPEPVQVKEEKIIQMPIPPKNIEFEKAPPTRQNGNVKKTVLDGVAAHSEIIIFDTETSGLKPVDDRILQLSAKKFTIKDGQLGGKIDELDIYIKPPFSIDPRITELNGISDDLLADKPIEEDAFIDIFNFFGEKPQMIAAYNTPFDYNFMANLYKRQEKVFAPTCQLDILDMARDLTKELKSHALDKVAEHYGITGDDFHNAGFDTDCAVKLFELFLKKYTDIDAPAEVSSSGKSKPKINGVTLFDKSSTLRRIYVNTDKGTLYYDLVKKVWASKDAKMEAFDMEYVEKEAWKCTEAENQAAFEKFTGSWSAAA
jgi:DNA polymerase III epsilon subunit family exonuclease